METKKPKVLLGVISNRSNWPVYFVNSLIALYMTTKEEGNIDIKIRIFGAAEIQQMRNYCVKHAIENGYDYIFMLDEDMMYPKDSIIKLIKHDKDFVVGSATQRMSPFLPTQYKEYKDNNFKHPSNRVFVSKKKQKLVKVGGTGVVGALIKTSIFSKLKAPYFKLEYKENGFNVLGSDIYFCEQLNKAKIPMYLDTTVNYEHEVLSFSNSFGIHLFDYRS